MPNFVKVASVEKIVPGTARQVDARGKALAVYNVDGEFHCTDGVCPHRGGPLGEGDLQDTIVTCPWHGWEYDVTTGAGRTNPSANLTCFAVQVEGGDIKVGIE